MIGKEQIKEKLKALKAGWTNFKSSNKHLVYELERVGMFYVLLIIIVLIYSSIIFSKPGDLFFTFKVIVEQGKVSSATSANDKYSQHKTIMVDRYNSYLDLSRSNNCVQSLLAKDQLIAEIKNTFEIVKQDKDSLSNFYDDFLSTNLKNIEQVVDLKSSCSFNVYISALKLPFEYSEEKRTTDSSMVIKINSEIVSDKTLLKTFIQRLSNEKITKQNQLDNVNGLILIVQNNNKIIGTNLKNNDFGGAVLKLYMNRIALNELPNAFDGKSVQTSDFQNSVYGICLLSTDKSCDPDSISSQVNSIFSSDLNEQFALQEKVLGKYLEVFLK